MLMIFVGFESRSILLSDVFFSRDYRTCSIQDDLLLSNTYLSVSKCLHYPSMAFTWEIS